MTFEVPLGVMTTKLKDYLNVKMSATVTITEN